VGGWVRIHPFADDPLSWSKIPAWSLGREGGADWRETKVKDCRMQGSDLVCLFDGVPDRNAAERLKGLLIAVEREALPATGVGEYYWADLIGLPVVNTASETLGQVKNLLETGAHNVLCVLSDDGVERLLPFVAHVVLAVEKAKDGEAGCVRVDWGSDW